MDLREIGEETAQAQEKLPNGVESSEKLEMSWQRRCTDIPVLPLKKGIREEDEILVEELSS